MTKQTEALKLALEALENAQANVGEWWPEAITAIREALAHIGNPITEQPAIPTVITCPFCSSEHVPGWLHDYNMDRGAHEEQPAIKQDLTPGQHQCNFPLCQSEDYQQALAEQIKQELYTGETAQRKPLTDEQIVKCWGQVSGTRHGYVAFARAIEATIGITKGNT